MIFCILFRRFLQILHKCINITIENAFYNDTNLHSIISYWAVILPFAIFK